MTQLADTGRPMTFRGKVLVSIGAGILLLSMLITGLNILLSPPERVLVVTMVQDSVQADRVALKEACGSLPGISVVADRGNPAASVQGRFPVRFNLNEATHEQEIALTECINANDEKVRGFLTEGDR